MAQTRGFVMQIEVGRAALVTVTVVTDETGLATFVIEDLDADPERFNERLSKLALLRDAMNRAEPVEIEHHEGEPGEVIDTVARVSRDALAAPGADLELVRGLVVEIAVESQNRTEAGGEHHDRAYVGILEEDLGGASVVLDLQAPERGVAAAQLGLLQDAQARGRAVRCLVDPADPLGRRIVQVTVDDHELAFGGEDAEEVDGFVEALSLLRLPLGEGGVTSNFAVVRFTTAPPFTGAGNVVDPVAFSPQLLTLLVPKGSLAYALFEAGLRDSLRMRVTLARLRKRDDERPNPVVRALSYGAVDVSDAPASAVVTAGELAVAFAAELLAPLASAARPVWTCIERATLDHGPEELPCAPDSPSSDLSAQSLRDLRLPYPAVWRGWGCTNHGVYRFEVGAASHFVITVNGRELCLVDATNDGIKLAHACLDGDIEVTISLDAWTCDQDLHLDVYRLR